MRISPWIPTSPPVSQKNPTVGHQLQLSHLTDGETECFGGTLAHSHMAFPEAEDWSWPLQSSCLLSQPQGLGCNMPGTKAFQKGTADGSSLVDERPGQGRRVLGGQGGASVRAGQGGGQPPTESSPPPRPEAQGSLNLAATPAPAPALVLAPVPSGAQAGALVLVPLGVPGGCHRRW